MPDSVKVLQKGAFRLNPGDASNTQGWGTYSGATLASNMAFPWIEFSKGQSNTFLVDNSISSAGFEDAPRLVSKYVEKSIGMNLRHSDLNNFLYWCMGIENTVKSVCVFVISGTPTVEPTAGATYTHNSVTYTFARREIVKSTTFHVFTSSAVPVAVSGTLTKVTGTGDATLSFSAHSTLLYEHLFELDALTRHIVAPTTAEQAITGYQAGDRKNRTATMGIAMGPLDFYYRDAMVKKFSLKSSAGQFLQLMADFCAYQEMRGDYNNSGWTYPAGLSNPASILLHSDLHVKIGAGPSGGNIGTQTIVGVTDWALDVNIPLRLEQDTVSGVNMSEPVMEGKYGIDLVLNLSRYSADTYQTVLDNYSDVSVQIQALSGYNMFEVLVGQAKIVEAGPTYEPVSRDSLKLAPFYSTDTLSGWLGSTAPARVENSPILIRTRNATSANQMYI